MIMSSVQERHWRIYKIVMERSYGQYKVVAYIEEVHGCCGMEMERIC